MNSQDNPINENDNLDESLSASDATPQSEKSLVDLWTTNNNEDAEIVTEIISAETAAQNDAEAIKNIGSEDSKNQSKSQKKSNIELDLDNWDFRNIDSTELESEPDLDVDLPNEPILVADDSPWVEEQEIDDPEPTNFLIDSEILEIDEPENVKTDNHESIELTIEQDLEQSADLEAVESLEPELISEISLDIADEHLTSLDESEFNLDQLELDQPDNSVELDLNEESLAAINLDDLGDGLGEPDLTNTNLDSTDLGEPDLTNINLDLADLDEPDLTDINLDSADLDEPDLTSINLDSADLDINSLELDQLGELNELNSLAEGGLENLGDDLDNLLSSEAEDESLDSLIMEPVGSLDSLENSLNSDLDSQNLDSLLNDAPQIEPTPVTPPPIPQSKPVVAKMTSPQPSPAKTQAFDQTMRVSVRKLDNLNNLIGELVVKRNRLEDDQERLRRFLDNLLGHVQSLGEAGAKMHDMYERSLLEGALMASRQSRANSAVAAGMSGLTNEKPQEEGLDALEMDRFTGFHLLSQDIIELIVRVREAASDIQFVVDETDKVAQTFRQVTSQLQDGMNSSRMVAFGQTADRLPRAVRDISRKQKKQTKLHVEGKDVLIDKMIVEHIYNPMTHLVNNAISHGIEQPEVRLKRGKTEAGNVYIRAFIQGNQTVITVRDDGAGIDPEIVKKKAVEKNLLTWAAAQNLSEQQIYELLFHPGFSTKDQADDFAGRGVGMDVVNTDLKKIRGSISTESKLGEGTIFTIRLPLVLSICKALTCVDNNSKIAFPIDGVENTKEYLPSDIQTNANGVRCISWQDKILPLRPLSGLLHYNRQIRRAGPSPRSRTAW